MRGDSDRTRGEVHGKRRTDDSSRGRESHQTFNELEEELRRVNDKLTQVEIYAASRDQLTKDIESKFTDYLKEYHQNVNDGIGALNMRLFHSTNEISEYQAELAAQEDEGAVRRIQELERRGAIAESGAQRIYTKGIAERVQG